VLFDEIIPRKIVEQDTGLTLRDIMFVENKSSKEILFGTDRNNPSRLHWGGLDESKHLATYFGTCGKDYDRIYVSQCDQLDSDKVFWAVDDRLRGTRGGFTRAWYDSNVTSNWAYHRFVLKEIGKNEDPSKFFCVLSQTNWNLSLHGTDYLAGIYSRPESVRIATTGESWEFVKGRFFTDYGQHNKIQFEDIPFKPTWSTNNALDYGYWPDPFAGVAYLTDHDENVFFLDEIEFYRHDPEMAYLSLSTWKREIFEQMAELMECEVAQVEKMFGNEYGGADFNKSEAVIKGKSFGDMLRQLGMDVQILTTEGLNRTAKEENPAIYLNRLFKIDPNHRNPFTGEMGAPHGWVTSRCARLDHQLTFTMSDPEKGGIYKSRDKNKFSDNEDATEHKDVLDAALRAAWETRPEDEPESPDTCLDPGELFFKHRYGKPKSRWAEKDGY
jgi:hypothetical protein